MNIEWDVEKGLLAFMVVLILGVVGVIFWQHGQASDLEAAMPMAERQLAEIGLLYTKNHILQQEIEKDDIAQGAQPFTYISEQARKSNIGAKAFSIDSPDNPEKGEGGTYEDADWELKPQGASKSFSREAIARFLLMVESYSNRMRVTRLRLTADQSKNARPDMWSPIITITDRKPLAGQ